MAGKNKEYVFTAIKLRADLAVWLDRYKGRTGVPKTFAIEKALEEYLNKMDPDNKTE